jgi:hypothetical protein
MATIMTIKVLQHSGLYYNHTMIVNYASNIVNKLEDLLTDYARVVMYDCHVFIIQATGPYCSVPETYKTLTDLLFKAFDKMGSKT